MRIVGGDFKGRALFAPPGSTTRPTSDRVRESIFNILAHGDYALEGARVIDLFAGTGAMGLEALSRGAVHALFVEEAAAARAAIRRNVEALNLTGRTRTFRRDATSLGPIPSGIKPFDLAFLDPPYDRGLLPPSLEGLGANAWLTMGATVVAEMRNGEAVEIPSGFSEADRRTYGETTVVFLKFIGLPA